MTSRDNSRKILGPFSRVEGDLEIKVEVSDGIIQNAWVNSPLFRGYEKILQGKSPLDSLVYTPRICGICSVSQSVASANALASAAGVIQEKNGIIATNAILATENMADHLTHFYLFFMPDFARECYANKKWHINTHARFKAQVGNVFNQVLPARSNFLQITGILAGKWPHSLAIQPGGTSKTISSNEKIKLLTLIKSFRYFLEKILFSEKLENVASLKNETELLQFADDNPRGDFSHFLKISRDLKLHDLGSSGNHFMSFGAYSFSDKQVFASGIWNGRLEKFDQRKIFEDVSNSWLKHPEDTKYSGAPIHPFNGHTIPDEDENSGYSWCKAPRYDNSVTEVGAISRQLINKHPLIRDLVNNYSGNVETRVVSRLLELALIVPKMENWIKEIIPDRPFCSPLKMPEECQGFGLIEAARGSLGHWVKIKNGEIFNYQIIAPTTWNFSPRDSLGNQGALEMALKNTKVGNIKNINGNSLGAAQIQHVIRSFDPCMVCTVH